MGIDNAPGNKGQPCECVNSSVWLGDGIAQCNSCKKMWQAPPPVHNDLWQLFEDEDGLVEMMRDAKRDQQLKGDEMTQPTATCKDDALLAVHASIHERIAYSAGAPVQIDWNTGEGYIVTPEYHTLWKPEVNEPMALEMAFVQWCVKPVSKHEYYPYGIMPF